MDRAMDVFEEVCCFIFCLVLTVMAYLCSVFGWVLVNDCKTGYIAVLFIAVGFCTMLWTITRMSWSCLGSPAPCGILPTAVHLILCWFSSLHGLYSPTQFSLLVLMVVTWLMLNRHLSKDTSSLHEFMYIVFGVLLIAGNAMVGFPPSVKRHCEAGPYEFIFRPIALGNILAAIVSWKAFACYLATPFPPTIIHKPESMRLNRLLTCSKIALCSVVGLSSMVTGIYFTETCAQGFFHYLYIGLGFALSLWLSLSPLCESISGVFAGLVIFFFLETLVAYAAPGISYMFFIPVNVLTIGFVMPCILQATSKNRRARLDATMSFVIVVIVILGDAMSGLLPAKYKLPCEQPSYSAALWPLFCANLLLIAYPYFNVQPWKAVEVLRSKHK